MKEKLKVAASILAIGLAFFGGVKTSDLGDWQWALNVVSSYLN